MGRLCGSGARRLRRRPRDPRRDRRRRPRPPAQVVQVIDLLRQEHVTRIAINIEPEDLAR
jgi:hypothetical protein